VAPIGRGEGARDPVQEDPTVLKVVGGACTGRWRLLARKEIGFLKIEYLVARP